MFTDRLWNVLNNTRVDVNTLKDQRTTDSQRATMLARDVDSLARRAEARFTILEDAVSRIARTLDANHITEACSHCGQVKPEDWKKAQV